ncbi:RICIN domain-containing protein [Streptomyces sp. TRM70350]|uniref:RICIN domain-containing protein n=1 Tax=Streptomyces sp. TRM70350 TaxID=2856165 RepID=UPI001C471335|nr:RICIN domain-containing protein [Streptomyces sp. TRM70350]MBV7696579.1 RICIN domain-containing protein [Streptomyces sp. TRM70350]
MAKITKRTARAVSLAVLAAVCSVPLSTATATAATDNAINCDSNKLFQCTKYVQFEVVNKAGASVDVQFAAQNSADRGWVKGDEHFGTPALPGKKVALDTNSREEYSAALTGRYEKVRVPLIAEKYDFDNFFNVSAKSSRGAAGAAIGTFREKGVTDGAAKAKSQSGTLESKDGGQLRMTFEALPPSSANFAKKYVLTIYDNASGRPGDNTELGRATTHADPVAGSTYDISAGGDLRIDVPQSSKESGKPLQLYSRNGTDAQQWKVVDTGAGGGYYQIRNIGNDLCLDITGMNPQPGAPVLQYQCDPNEKNQPNQLWRFDYMGANVTGPSTYKIVSKTGLALDVAGSVTSGAALTADKGRSWIFQPQVRNNSGTYQQAMNSLSPDTDYKMDACRSYNGADTRPAKLMVNGKTYTWDQLSGTGGNWLTTNSRGQVIFESPSSFGPVTCSFRPAVLSAKVTRLTGQALEQPVYRVDIPETSRVFDGGLPTDMPVSPYVVEGLEKGSTGSVWRKKGDVLPISAPKVDRTAKRITYGAASFYFQNEAGKPEVTKLRISGAYRAEREVDFSTTKLPPDDLLLSYGLKVTPATQQPVTANGLAQEPLKVKLTGADGRPISPDSQEAWLYDHLYFLDGNHKLITNMFQDGSYTTVTTVKGAYVNTLPAIQAANDPVAYLSTTVRPDSPQSGITAHLDTSPIRRIEATVDNVPTKAAVTGAPGAAIPGIYPVKPAADPESGVLYSRGNGKTVNTGVLTRYDAVTALTDLPVRTPYLGYFVPHSGGTALRLNSEDGMGDTGYLDSGFVMTDGTFNPVHVIKQLPPA